jgi:tetratricopeptide (TPR) repeat protein
MQKALILDVQGDRQRSFDTYTQILGIAPEFVPALNNLAAIYSHKAEVSTDGAERAKLLKEAMEHATRAYGADNTLRNVRSLAGRMAALAVRTAKRPHPDHANKSKIQKHHTYR